MGEEGRNVSELCRQFGVSRKTAYKWCRLGSGESFADRSRRPLRSPALSSGATEEAVLAVRERHPSWGGRKIRAVLLAQGRVPAPSPSTITAILRRHGRLDGPGAGERRGFQRFERERPNELWQMDFKGHFAMRGGARCHPLTLLDDHSRFLLGAWPCANEQGTTVRAHLEEAFARYGMPEAILCDNGGPWSSRGAPCPSALEAWLMRLGVRPLHGRPYHPQTQGKLERLHRTLLGESIRGQEIADLHESRRRFDAWREVYNHERPHDSLGLKTPASRYQSSAVPFPAEIPSPRYLPQDRVRTVGRDGWIYVDGRQFQLGDGLAGQPIALRPTPERHRYEIYFCQKRLAELDLEGPEPVVTYAPKTVTHVPERV